MFDADIFSECFLNWVGILLGIVLSILILGAIVASKGIILLITVVLFGPAYICMLWKKRKKK
jgi:hypothetical protein